MLEEFSSTVDKIYAAASDSRRWQETLVAIEDFTRSAGAVIDMVPTSEAVAPTTFAGSFTKENCAEYARDYQAICPRIRHAIQHPTHGTHFDYLFMTESAMDRDPVYAWLGKHGLRYYLGSPLATTPNFFVVLSLQRTRRQGHVQEEDIARFELLKPHLARAASFADQLGTLHSYQRFSSAFFESLPQAVFALDANGRLLFANGSARQQLRARDGLTIEAGQLRCAQPGDQVRLDVMIRSATRPSANLPAAWLRLSRPSGRIPYAVFVSPLNLREDEELAAAEAKVLVMVHDPAQRRSADVEMLTSLFGLTQTEARLASALSGGHSVETSSSLLGMQPATARGHLKSVFRKTGVSRQQDLVRLLTSLSAIAATST